MLAHLKPRMTVGLREIVEVTVNMVTLRVLVVCLILHYCAAEEYCIIPSVDTQCCTRPCHTLENLNLNSNSDAIIQLTLQPGNHSLSSKVEISNKKVFTLSLQKDSFNGTIIICNDHGQLVISNINHVEIIDIAFLGCESIRATNITTLVIKNCSYFNDYNRGSMLLQLNNTNVTRTFHKTRGTEEVSMLFSNNNNITIEKSDFVVKGGTLILCSAGNKTTITIKNCTFHNSNLMQGPSHNTHSALINIFNKNFTMEGSIIESNVGERIIFNRESTVNISSTTIRSNSAVNCILCLVKDHIYLRDLIVTNNSGNFSIIHLLKTGTHITGGLKFSHNSGAFLNVTSRVKFTGNNMFKNCNTDDYSQHLQVRGTLTVLQNALEFSDYTEFTENYSGKSGGTLYISQSKLRVLGNILVINNLASESGGGAFLHLTSFAEEIAHFQEIQHARLGVEFMLLLHSSV